MPSKPKSNAADLLSGRVSQIPLDTNLQAPQPTVSAAQQMLGSMPSSQLVTPVAQDLVGRSMAGVIGAPVDLAAMALAPFGYQHPAPVAGSEWIGAQMEKAGAISPIRRPAAELMASLAAPAALPKAAATAGLAFMAAMSPEGKARLLADLTAGKGSGSYRLGDVTPGQQKALQRLGTPPTESRDVMMTDAATGHMLDRRVNLDGFSPEEVVRFAEQAMQPRSSAWVDPAAKAHKPALSNSGLRDPLTGRSYTAHMPMAPNGESLDVVTVIPRGLPARKTKAPE